jgi:MFS family permease
MSKQFEFYYLQRDSGGTWDTLGQSESVAMLTDSFASRLAAGGDGSFRIVGAAFDESVNNWTYEQLAFIDPASVNLNEIVRGGIAGAGAVTGPGDAVADVDVGPQASGLGVPRSETTHATGPETGAAAAQGFDMRFAYLAVILGGAIVGLSFGVRAGFGFFLGPISLEFGFGRETFALSLAIQNLVWGITQPFTGAFADRYGAFKAILVGGICFAGGMFSLAYSSTPEMFHLGSGVLVGLGLSGTGTGILFGAVSRLFPPDKRSWALGVVGAAGSLGTFLVVPGGQFLLDQFGWSVAGTVLGFVVLMVIPLGLIFLKGGNRMSVAAGPSQSFGEALRQAFGHPSFWFLCTGFFVCGFHVTFIMIHLPSYAVDLGFSAQTGAWALGVVGLANVVGSYSAGVLGGKFSKKYLLSGLYMARAVVIAGFVLLPPSEITIYVFAITMGLVWLSTVPLTGGLVADIYGPRHMSMLFGIVFLSHQVGGFLGGWLGGYMYDATGSYDLIWWVAVGLGVFSAIVHWPIREEPVPQPAIA